MKRLLLVAIMALAAVGIVPGGAQAAECVDDTGIGTIDNKIVGDTCWDCLYLKVRGQVILSSPCGE